VHRIGNGINGNPYLYFAGEQIKLEEAQVIRKTPDIRIVLSRKRW